MNLASVQIIISKLRFYCTEMSPADSDWTRHLPIIHKSAIFTKMREFNPLSMKLCNLPLGFWALLPQNTHW
jgi:hypothetical protein